MHRRDFIRFASTAVAAGWPAGASAQGVSGRTTRIIIPITSGSPVDAAGRVIAQHLQTALKQNVVVENRPGAGTTLGSKAVASASPDGATLLLTGSQLVYLPAMYTSFGIDTVRSLVPVAPLVSWSHVIVVIPSVPATNLQELVAYAKESPGKLVFGFGQGTVPQMLGASLARAAGIEIAMIPYRGGEQARADLLGGRVHMNMAAPASVMELIRDGRVRPLAYTGATRSPDLPDVPTTAETGYAAVGYHPDVWLGLWAPPGTPPSIVNPINAAVAESLRAPEVAALLKKLGFEPMSATADEFARFVDAEIIKWPPLVKAAGLIPE